MAGEPAADNKENPTASKSTEKSEEPETPEKPKSDDGCSECEKPAKFFSIYNKENTKFCSAECHAKRNERESTPNLMLVQIQEEDEGEKKKHEAGTSDQPTDEILDAEIDVDIFEACNGGLANNKLLHKLLEGGADVNQKDPNDQPLINYATANGDVTTLRILLEAGADVNQRGKNQTTPLMIAAETNAKEKLTFLLSKDASTTLKDEEGKTALHRTERSRNTACAELLLENNPDLLQMTDTCQQTALHQAAGEGNNALVEFLLEKGADISGLDNLSRSPLHWAVIQGMDLVVATLLEHNCDKVINEPDRFQVRPIHYAIQSNRLDIAELLIGKGCELGAGGSRGLTALIYAASCGKKDICEIIIPHCEDINIGDSSGWTALHHAAKRGDDAICDLLLEHKADPNRPDLANKQSPLYMAVGSKHVSTVKLLLRHNETAKDARDEQNRLPLHYAAEQGQMDIVSALIEDNSSERSGKTESSDPTHLINSPDGFGHTPLYLAASNEHIPCCRYLLDNGAEVDDRSRELLYTLGVIDREVEEEEEEKEEDAISRSSDAECQSPRERYGVADAEEGEEELDDLDLGSLADSDAVALNSRYIYESRGPPPKSSPRTTSIKSLVIPRKMEKDDRQESFNHKWKELLEQKRKSDKNLKAKNRRHDYSKSPYAQSLVSNEVLQKYNLKVPPYLTVQLHSASSKERSASSKERSTRSKREFQAAAGGTSRSQSSKTSSSSGGSSYLPPKKYSYSVTTGGS